MWDDDLPCILDYSFKNVKNQIKRASDLGIIIIIILGPKEMEAKEVTIKNLFTEEQKVVGLDDIIEEIFNILDEIEEQD